MGKSTKEEKFKIGFAKTCVIVVAFFVPLTPFAYLLEPPIYGVMILIPAAAGAGGGLSMALALVIEIYEMRREK